MATGGGAGRGAGGGNTHYNQAYMMHHQQQQQPPVMPTSTPPVRPVGQQQAQELLRKQRKCVSCGNTALAKCDFRACGTCCAKAKNQCQVHGSKQVGTSETPASTPQYPWPAVPGMGMMPPYMRPPYSVMSMGGYRLPYGSPGLRMQAPPIQTEAQKEAQLEKARKAFVAAQKETLMINSWRVVKLKAYADAELAFEDEAFDRYMHGVNWLEETLMVAPEGFQIESWVDQKDDSRLLDAARAKLEGDSKKKELQKQKLQRVVAKSFQKFRRGDTDIENLLEIHEFSQAGFGRRDNKRMKVQTADGKEYLKRISAWEDLFQGTRSISNMAEVSLFLDTYKETLGHDLGHALPHLIKRDTTCIKKDVHESAKSRIAEHENHVSAPMLEIGASRENQKEGGDIERKSNTGKKIEADGVLQAENQEAECPTAASEQGADGRVLGADDQVAAMEIEKQEAQAGSSAADKQETDYQTEAEGPTSASEPVADDQMSALELEKQEASVALETDQRDDGHTSAMEIEKKEGADGETAAVETDNQGADDQAATMEIQKKEGADGETAAVETDKQGADDQAATMEIQKKGGAHGETAAVETDKQGADDEAATMEIQKKGGAHGETAAVETDKQGADDQAATMEIQKKEGAHGETAVVETDKQGADDQAATMEIEKQEGDDGQAQKDDNAVEAEVEKDEARKQEAGDGRTGKQEKDGISSKDIEACAADDKTAVVAEIPKAEEDWVQDLPRVPVRRLVMNLIKNQKSLADDGRDRFMKGFGCCRVDLDEQSSKRVYDNQHRYSFEAL